ncbi:MAG: CotH kinase family protein [Bacteroidales bacterium]
MIQKNDVKFYCSSWKSVLLILILSGISIFSTAQGINESYLPVISIDTRGQSIISEARIIAGLKVIDNGKDQLNNIFVPGTDFDGNVAIKIRGQSSQMFPKKSFSLELRNNTGADTSASLLGLPTEEDWVLHAHYTDKTMMRNALTFHLGRLMGNWQPGFRYCVVYINGEYNGIYLLLESIKRGKDRVDISKLEPGEISGDDLTGGYIFKADKYGDLQPYEYFWTNPFLRYPGQRNYSFTYVYPDADVIAPEQSTYLRSFLNDFENSLNSSSFNDELTGFKKYIDWKSFIDFQLMEELTNNVDGYIFSTFFYKEKDSKGGKMHAGPLWDFDLGYGNLNYSDFNLSTTYWHYPYYRERWVMHWWLRLMEDGEYARYFASRWKELRSGPFRTDSILNYIDNTVSYLGSEINRNYNRWPIIGQYIWPNYYVGTTYNEDLEWFKNWLTSRLRWMDENVSAPWMELSGGFVNNLLVYPNPATDIVNIALNLRIAGRVNIDLIDLAGRKVKTIIFESDNSGFQEFNFDITNLSSGNYQLIVYLNNNLVARRGLVKIGN